MTKTKILFVAKVMLCLRVRFSYIFLDPIGPIAFIDNKMILKTLCILRSQSIVKSDKQKSQHWQHCQHWQRWQHW